MSVIEPVSLLLLNRSLAAIVEEGEHSEESGQVHGELRIEARFGHTNGRHPGRRYDTGAEDEVVVVTPFFDAVRVLEVFYTHPIRPDVRVQRRVLRVLREQRELA